MGFRKTLAGLLTIGMLLSPLKASDSDLYSVYGLGSGKKSNKIEMTSDYASLKLSQDNYLEEYRDDLKKPIEFWKKVFTTDSSKSFVINPYNLNHRVEESSKIEGKRFDNYWVINGKKQFMKKSIKRGYKHLDYIIDSLEKHDLPVSLAVVPLFESGFKEDAVSHAGAVGMWQFMEWTARRYGLEVNGEKDERLDPHKATSAFIKYYKDSQEQFDNHLFSLVSFNAGRLPVFRYEWSKKNPIKAIRSGIGFEARNYPSMCPVSKDLLTNPRKYFPFIFHDPNLEKKKLLNAPINLGNAQMKKSFAVDKTHVKNKSQNQPMLTKDKSDSN